MHNGVYGAIAAQFQLYLVGFMLSFEFFFKKNNSFGSVILNILDKVKIKDFIINNRKL